MIENLGSFAYYNLIKYAADIALLLLAFCQIKPASASWRRRIASGCVLLALLPIYVSPVSIHANMKLSEILLVHSFNNLFRFGICAAYLRINKQIRWAQASYFSGTYLVVFNAYRQITGPTGLGSVALRAALKIPIPMVSILITELFGYIVALLLIIWVRKEVFCRERRDALLQRNIMILCILIAICFSRASVFYIRTEFQNDLILSLLSLIPVLLLVLDVLLENSISAHVKLEEEHAQHMLEVYRLKSVEIQHNRDENMRILLHDIKNHLFAIRQMAKNTDSEEIERYVNALVSEYSLDRLCVDTGNDMINGLLSVKMEEGAQHQVQFSVVMDARPLANFSDVDLNTIFGNALDNAIEGCLTVDPPGKRFVDIHGGLVANQMVITITNSFCGKIKMCNGLLASTKQETSLHGIGLKSIERTVKKYGGVLEYTAEAERFTIIVMLPTITKQSE